VLPAANRLRNGKDFARTTRNGARVTSPSLVLYVLTRTGNSTGPQVGLIVNKAVGGSVVRHRVARQLRHLIAPQLYKFDQETQIVIRTLRMKDSYAAELEDLVERVQKKLLVTS
jgi:ribonuclease P protein component